MSNAEFQLQTVDGLVLHGHDWRPQGEAKAAVCLVHGIGEHIGRYEHVAAALNQAGFAVVGTDLRGHGRSEGPRGYVSDYDRLLDDIALLLEETKKRYSGRPQFLYGHSLGGSLVMFYALRRRPALAGIVATGPELRLAFEPPAWKTLLGRLMFSLWPALSMASGLEVAALSHDPEVVRRYVEDPLVHNRVSPRLGIGMLDNGRWLLDHASEFRLPLLVMSGGQDRITSPQASREFAERVPTDCTFKLWDGLYHEVHNEPQKQEVIAYMIAWLQAHTV